MGREEQAFSKELEALMKEWLKEEEETAPILTEEQKILMGNLPNLHMDDKRLKELCRSWKDALIVNLLEKRSEDTRLNSSHSGESRMPSSA